MTRTLVELQQQIGSWSRANFGTQESKAVPGLMLGSLAPLLGIAEELGEYDEAHFIKANEPDAIDAIGDVAVYLCDYCERESVEHWVPLQLVSFLPDCPQNPTTSTLLTVPLGLLFHATLKRHQGIRNFDNPEVYFKARNHALTLLVQVLCNICEKHDVELVDVLDRTWTKVVRKRDWKTEPTTGGNVDHRTDEEPLTQATTGTNPPEDPKLPEPPEMIHPYCRGCGHHYFSRPKVPANEAPSALCTYCIEDQRGESCFS